MGLFTSDRARRDGRVTIVQFVTSLAGFLLFSVMGGVLVAGLALPAVTVGGQAVNGTPSLFEALPEEFDQTDLPQASIIYASDGTTLLATFYTRTAWSFRSRTFRRGSRRPRWRSKTSASGCTTAWTARACSAPPTTT